jgi:hypothetical protein
VSDDPGLWEVRTLSDGLTRELWDGGNPALVLAQGERRVRVDLAQVKPVVAGLTDAAAGLAELLASGGRYDA